MTKEKLPSTRSSQAGQKKTVSPTSKASKPSAVSIYLSAKDKASLEEIAQKNNINRHMLLSYAVRYFLAGYRTGHIKLDPTIEAGKVVLSVHLDLEGPEV